MPWTLPVACASAESIPKYRWEAKKLSKQFQYASRAGIRFVVLAGDDERARGVVAVKDLTREQQFEIPREELASTLQVELEQAKVM